jgi:hypothetical protein
MRRAAIAVVLVSSACTPFSAAPSTSDGGTPGQGVPETCSGAFCESFSRAEPVGGQWGRPVNGVLDKGVTLSIDPSMGDQTKGGALKVVADGRNVSSRDVICHDVPATTAALNVSFSIFRAGEISGEMQVVQFWPKEGLPTIIVDLPGTAITVGEVVSSSTRPQFGETSPMAGDQWVRYTFEIDLGKATATLSQANEISRVTLAGTYQPPYRLCIGALMTANSQGTIWLDDIEIQ